MRVLLLSSLKLVSRVENLPLGCGLAGTRYYLLLHASSTATITTFCVGLLLVLLLVLAPQPLRSPVLLLVLLFTSLMTILHCTATSTLYRHFGSRFALGFFAPPTHPLTYGRGVLRLWLGVAPRFSLHWVVLP